MTEYWEDRIMKAQVSAAKDLFRILQVLQCKPLRYNQIKRLLNLKPAQLERLLKELRKMFWIIARTVPNKAWIKHWESQKGIAIPNRARPPKNCKILVEYYLSKRGTAVLRAYEK
jgi:hypothetical protein